MGVFEQNKTIEKLGQALGHILAYFVFTTVLYLILVLLNKIPSSWSYPHIMAITFAIAVIGIILKRLLK